MKSPKTSLRRATISTPCELFDTRSQSNSFRSTPNQKKRSSISVAADHGDSDVPSCDVGTPKRTHRLSLPCSALSSDADCSFTGYSKHENRIPNYPGPTLHMAHSNFSPAPFSHDPLALAANQACDYTIRITYEMAKSGSAPRPVRVYADGAYDMFHSGHARQLMQAKSAFPNTYLIVGVSNDADLHRYKGRTVMNEAERYEAVRHCRYVDEVLTDAPWSVTPEFLRKHKIDFVAHDDIPYASADSEDIYKPLKDAGMFLVTQRTEGISTTDVIGRIVRDYDMYLRRNLRRGLSRKDLNISFMKEKKLQFQDNFETIMKRGSTLIQNFDNKRRELVDQLEDMSHEFVRSFMRIFGADGRFRNWFNGKKHASSEQDDEAASPSSSEHPEDYELVGRHGDSESESELDDIFSKYFDAQSEKPGPTARKRSFASSSCSQYTHKHNGSRTDESSPKTKSRRVNSSTTTARSKQESVKQVPQSRHTLETYRVNDMKNHK